MIEYRKGDLLDVNSGIILHGCNAQGVMDSGVALAIRKKYPQVYWDYMGEYECYGSKLNTGDVIDTWVGKDLIVMSAITQKFYGRDGKRYVNYADMALCFNTAFSRYRGYGYAVNFPKLGTGFGGGDWGIIEQLINDCDPEDKVKKICWEL